MAALAATEATSLEPVASLIAEQDVKVLCYEHGEPEDPLPDSWAYVYLGQDTIHMSKEACDGAAAIASGAMLPLWQLGLGALVLAHESYHLKLSLPWGRRANEAQTECRAVKRVPQTLTDLGANPELAAAVLPWSLAIHFKISTFQASYANYNYPSCAVPVFRDFWP